MGGYLLSNIIIHLLSLPVMEQKLVLECGAHRTDRETAEPASVVHAVTVRKEVEVPRVVRAVSAERTRPVVAVAASVDEFIDPTVAGGGQEKSVTVACGEKSTDHTVLCCPIVSGVLI